MHQIFADLVKELDPLFQHLVDQEPHSTQSIGPVSGVYLFSEEGKHLYVGRSRKIGQRYGQHTRPSAPHNQASFCLSDCKKSIGD